MRLLALIGALAIIIVVGAAIFFFGGFYDVAATEEDPGIVNWALVKIRVASVTRHAGVTPAVNLDDPAIVQAGARAFAARGRGSFHGAPGGPRAKFFRRLAARSARLERGRTATRARAAFLGDQERHQDDGNAELSACRRRGQGNLVARRLRQKAAEGVGGRIQGVECAAVGAYLTLTFAVEYKS